MATIVGLFEHAREVDHAIQELEKVGFTKSQIGVVARHETLGKHGLSVGTGAEMGAITGATTGGIAGVLIGLGALLIPGLQIVAAGTFLVAVGAAVLGLAGGAVGGGLIGALAGFGIEETSAQRYAAGVNEGHILVTVQSDPERAETAATILREAGALEVDVAGNETPEMTVTPAAQTSFTAH